MGQGRGPFDPFVADLINENRRAVDADWVRGRKEQANVDERPVVPLVGVDNFYGALDMRVPKETVRRVGERRTGGPGRRPEDLVAVRRQYVQAAVAVVGALTALISAGFALVRPPIARRASELCGDGLGGQQIVHRGLSWLLIPAVVGLVLAVTVPHRRKRPVLTVLCVGLVLGMGIGAVLRVETVVTGLCLA